MIYVRKNILDTIFVNTLWLVKVKNNHCSKFSKLSNWKEEAWKNQGFNEIQTRDLRDTGAMLYQLSYEATHWNWFFQASSFQLLKLENLLRWSFFTLIYNRSWNIWIISYILHITLWLVLIYPFTPTKDGNIWYTVYQSITGDHCSAFLLWNYCSAQLTKLSRIWR